MENDVFTAPVPEAEVVEETTENTNPLKGELDKIKEKKEGGRTELEKALYKKQQLDKQIKLLRGDEQEEEVVEDDDNAPLTRGEFKKLQQGVSVKTASQLAEEITDEVERELVIYHVQNTIKSTGNPAEDLALAKTLVNGKKNELVLEEVARKGTAKPYSSGSSAPLKEEDKQIEFTNQEKAFMGPPFNLSKEDILRARKG